MKERVGNGNCKMFNRGDERSHVEEFVGGPRDASPTGIQSDDTRTVRSFKKCTRKR